MAPDIPGHWTSEEDFVPVKSNNAAHHFCRGCQDSLSPETALSCAQSIMSLYQCQCRTISVGLFSDTHSHSQTSVHRLQRHRAFDVVATNGFVPDTELSLLVGILVTVLLLERDTTTKETPIKHLIGRLLLSFRGWVHDHNRGECNGSQAGMVLEQSVAERQREWGAGGLCFSNLKVHPQRHIYSDKNIPPNRSWTVHQLGASIQINDPMGAILVQIITVDDMI